MSVRIIIGDVREKLRELPDGSVHCVVTSPPYFGLRDYQTGQWEGGDAACDHQKVADKIMAVATSTLGGGKKTTGHVQEGYRNQCGKCGARRIDRQIGLETTPEAYVAELVEVFREVRRVIRDDGTVWLNLGDSYAASGQKQTGRNDGGRPERDGGYRNGVWTEGAWTQTTYDIQRTSAGTTPGLKPKDLIGIPWRVAFALQADGWYLRSEIIWHKVNPMPESVRDRPTKSHEQIFLLSKQSRYYYDTDAVAEAVQALPSLSSARGVLHPEEVREGRNDLQILLESPRVGVAGSAWGAGQDTGGECSISTNGRREGHSQEVPNVGASAGIHEGLLAVGPGEGGRKASQRFASGPGTAAEIFAQSKGASGDSAETGGAPRPDGLDSKHPDGGGVDRNQGSVQSQVCILRGVGSTADSGSCDADQQGRASYEGKRRAGVQALQQQEKGQATKRNLRDVWSVATQPYSEAHFATFPPSLIEPCIKAGTSERGCCPECGAPWVRVTDDPVVSGRRDPGGVIGQADAGMYAGRAGNSIRKTIGWQPSCSCYPPLEAAPPCFEPKVVPCTVLDIFGGAGTTGLVADRLQRNAILIELNPAYAEMSRNRIATEAGIFGEVCAA